MTILAGFAGLALILLVLVDSFETTVLPRRVTHRFRFARFFYLTTWKFWRRLALLIAAPRQRESFLSVFGPLSLLGLLVTWLAGLAFGFALLHWSLGTALSASDRQVTLATYLYWSGGTLFTLGYGDVTPLMPLGRILAVIEAGMGFGFLAMIIGYLPVIYQTFSRREAMIGLLDARGGSPPSASQLLLRVARSGNMSLLDPFLAEWERWSAELLESHLSFPVLSYYRSQHDNQSWLSSLTAILDTCAVIIVGLKGHNPFQAKLTFAIARHAAVDLGLVFKAPPVGPTSDRLPESQLRQLQEQLSAAGFPFDDQPRAETKLAELRAMYEPFVNSLSERFLFALPPFVLETEIADNWQRSAWMKRAPNLGNLSTPSANDEHFG